MENAVYNEAFKKLFGDISSATKSSLLNDGEEVDLNAGDYLFRQDDVDYALYIVISGRLRAIIDGSIILGDIAAGEPVGEFALFTKETRSSSVVALRPSLVLKISESLFLSTASKVPQLTLSLSRYVINRLSSNSLKNGEANKAKNIALINLFPAKDISSWTNSLIDQYSNSNVPLHTVRNQDLEISKDLGLFENIENNPGQNILTADARNIEWTRLCIAYCDLIVVVADFSAPADLTEFERQIDIYTSTLLSKKIYLVLLHPQYAPQPANTQRWFVNRKIDLHLHFRENNTADARRIFRILNNRAVGLVLGGGGAKGFAHAGALKALQERAIEVDFVGGTSAGALMAFSMSFTDFELPKLIELLKSAAKRGITTNDFTIPFLSIMSGSKFGKFIDDTVGDTCIEDLWINSYCISTNFSNASMEIQDFGKISPRLQASIAVPGMFPPVIINKQLHVDGGVMDNLPVETMSLYPVNEIIAISLSILDTREVRIDAVPKASQMLWDKISRSKKYSLPSLSSILVNSLTVNSRQKQENIKEKVGTYIELDLKRFGFLDWDSWEALIEAGYQQTKKYLTKS